MEIQAVETWCQNSFGNTDFKIPGLEIRVGTVVDSWSEYSTQGPCFRDVVLGMSQS